MSPPPKTGLRWVEISRSALEAALGEFAGSTDSIDISGDGYGFGQALVSDIAGALGLSTVGGSADWVERAHRAGAQRFKARVVHVKDIPEGEEISYGGHFRTSTPSTLALVSAGFADGVPRLDPVGGFIELAGEKWPIAGRIAMDQLIVDVTGTHPVPGEVVTIWGGQIVIDQWSQWSGRSVREIGSTLATRVNRVVVA